MYNSEVVDSLSKKTTAWFAVLPLIHFLKGMAQPFDDAVHLKDVVWYCDDQKMRRCDSG